MRGHLMPWNWGRRLLEMPADETPGFVSLQREVNRLFDEFLRVAEGYHPEIIEQELSRFTPKVDVKETDKEIVISAEMPGMTEKDIEISLADDTLTIRGEKREEKEEKVKGHYRMERSYGAFHRNLPLPCSVDKEKVEAVFKNGVIAITLPKTVEAQKETKKIAVKTA